MARVYKGAGTMAARIAGEMSEMDSAVARVESAIKAEASDDVDTGDFMDSIESGRIPGKKGVTDRAVWSTDPAAFAIEFGHTAKNGTEVPGQFNFVNGARRF